MADASSDILSRPIDVSRFGLIYAGAQKNLGPSGVTLVVIREDLIASSQASLPAMLNYKVQAENNSLYNTPNTFGVYILGLTLKWIQSQGGLAGVGAVNERKAKQLYAEIDRTGFYRGTAQPRRIIRNAATGESMPPESRHATRPPVPVGRPPAPGSLPKK